MMSELNKIREIIDTKKDEAIRLAYDIWNYAELSYSETQSANALIESLEKEGFVIERGIADIPTAFTATFKHGSGKPVVAILAEYDALDGLSQKAACPVKEAQTPGGHGHGCGHNLLGTGSYLAAVTLKEYMLAENVDGTIVFFGCPAEEGAGSKQFIARAGYFNDIDFAYTWHPSTITEVGSYGNVAIMGGNFVFDGISAHAGSQPHLGRSALDTAELMNVGCNYLREHMIDGARIHYAYSDAGGVAPNVVQSHVVIKYEVRAPKISQAQELFARVVDVARGAALMCGTRMEYKITMAFSDYTPNKTLAAVVDEAMKECGAPQWSEEDYNLAYKFLHTYPKARIHDLEEELEAYFEPDEIDQLMMNPLDPKVHGFDRHSIKISSGSTDVGDVGYAVPTLSFLVATSCLGNAAHSWQNTAFSASEIGMKGMVKAGEIMALSALKTMASPETIEKAKAELKKKNGGRYVCPLPEYATPPIGTY